jgi:hypothetical protein
MAQRARELGSIRSAHHAAAQLIHARDGLDVALHGGAPDVLAGETHVDVSAEDAVAEHLAELVLGVHEALHGTLAYPPRGKGCHFFLILVFFLLIFFPLYIKISL